MNVLRVHAPDQSPGEEPTVAEILEAYVADQATEILPATLADRARIGRAFCETFGKRSAVDLRPSEVKAWILGRPGWKAANTRWCVLLSLKRLFNWAVDDQFIARNPIKTLSLRQGEPRRATSEEEFQVMLRHSDPAFRRFLVFMRLTGVRPGEARAVEWEWVDWQRRLIVIPKDRHKTGGKTGRPRIIPLPRSAVRLLLWLQLRPGGPPWPMPGRRSATGAIFRNSFGKPWTRVAIGQRVKLIREESGLSGNATLHGIRHLWGTVAVARGGNVKVIADAMGHARVGTFEKYYCHLGDDPNCLIEAAEIASGRATPKRDDESEGP